MHPNRFAPDPSPRPRHSKRNGRSVADRRVAVPRFALPAPARAARVPDRPVDCRRRRPEKKATRIASDDRGHARDLCCRVRPAFSPSAPPPLPPSSFPVAGYLLVALGAYTGHFMSFACVHDVFFRSIRVCSAAASSIESVDSWLSRGMMSGPKTLCGESGGGFGPGFIPHDSWKRQRSADLPCAVFEQQTCARPWLQPCRAGVHVLDLVISRQAGMHAVPEVFVDEQRRMLAVLHSPASSSHV